MIEAKGKHLTIRDAKNEIKKLENELDIYLTKKIINRNKVLPSASRIKDIVVDSSHINLDSFLNYVDKGEELDAKSYEILASIYAYQSYIAKELQRMSEYDEIGYIDYLRNVEKKSWKEIDKILHRGEDYSRTKFKRYKKKEK